MSLYQCEKCGVIENTALSGIHWRRVQHQLKQLSDNLPIELCSECNPEIGMWHGRFEKKYHPIGSMITDCNGNIKSK